MSRGLGRWQRHILEAVHGGWIYLINVLPDGAGRADYVAAYRAAYQLADRGRITIFRYSFGRKKVAVGPPGARNPEERRTIRPVEPRVQFVRSEDGRLVRDRFGHLEMALDGPPLPPHRIDWRAEQVAVKAKC